MADLLDREAVTLAILQAGQDATSPEMIEWVEHALNNSSPPEVGPVAQKYVEIDRLNHERLTQIGQANARADLYRESLSAREAQAHAIAIKMRALSRLIRATPRAKTKAQIAGALRNLARDLRRA